MALWDRQVADLRSVGVQFSDVELESLRDPGDGMRVAHLHPVVDPSSPDGTVWYMTDADGAYLYQAEVLTLTHPNAMEMDGWPNPKSVPVIDAMDNTWDILNEAFPFYLAICDMPDIDDGLSAEGWRRTEEVHPYPFWSCYPLVTADEVAAAIRLVGHAERRLRASLWDDILQICIFEEHTEFCLSAFDVWDVVNGWSILGDDISEQIWNETFDEWSDPQDGPKWVAAAVQRLIDANYVDNPRWTDVRKRMNVNTPIALRPIEEFANGDEEALHIWRAITARSEYVRALLPQYYPNKIAQRMHQAEGLYEC
ncbi:MAG TPA: hypothetical protein VIT65_22360 [Microlunatus sp.]